MEKETIKMEKFYLIKSILEQEFFTKDGEHTEQELKNSEFLANVLHTARTKYMKELNKLQCLDTVLTRDSNNNYFEREITNLANSINFNLI